MPGYLLDANAAAQCAHAGQARPTSASPRVKLSGRALVTQSSSHSITGCTLPPPAGGPCVSAAWITGATRVRSGGQPVLLQDSRAQCIPTGTGLFVVSQQMRVRGR